MLTNVSGSASRLLFGYSTDLWKYWAGQFLSALGGSFTAFAIPLLVFRLTHSAINLGIATAVEYVPFLVFGLMIGAWVDRADRKRLLIGVEFGRGLVIAVIPVLAAVGLLTIWDVYLVGFVNATLWIAFDAAEVAVLPHLIPEGDLVTANGRMQASYAVAGIIGPMLAGVCMSYFPIQDVFLVDAFSFAISAITLVSIATSLNVSERAHENTSIREDLVQGLWYVLHHPVLRNIAIMMALVNVVVVSVEGQLVFYARRHLHATSAEIGFLFAAGAVGTIILSLAAGPLRKRWSFCTVALGALMLDGLTIVALAIDRWFVGAVGLLAIISGLGVLFNINIGSLRQAIVPDELLGRVQTASSVLALTAIPIGAVAGGVAIDRTRNVEVVYAIIGILTFLIPVGFAFTALSRADQYLSSPAAVGEQEMKD